MKTKITLVANEKWRVQTFFHHQSGFFDCISYYKDVENFTPIFSCIYIHSTVEKTRLYTVNSIMGLLV